MIHQPFDLASWKARYSNLVDVNDRGEIGYFVNVNCVGPKDVCRLDEMRETFRTQIDFGPKVAADVFVLFPGEPEDQSITKIGGVPYRPADLPWPRRASDEGPLTAPTLQEHFQDYHSWQEERPSDEEIIEEYNEWYPAMRFLGQFNFADSKDLVPELPGDVLLLFGNYDWPFIEYYEWHPLGLTDPIRSEQVPTSGYPEYEVDEDFGSSVWYGQIFRTQDYPEAGDQIPDLQQRFGSGAESVFRMKAHRIGGAPHFIQTDPCLPGTLLCVFNGISSSGDEHPIFLDLSGCIYISIDENGELHWADQCT
jgi:hypothetical protein